MIERVLRWSAIAIAVLAFADPAIESSGRSRPVVGFVVQDGPSMQLPSNSGTESRGAVAERARKQLLRDLGGEFEFIDALDSSAASAVVVVGDRYPERTHRERVPASTVTVSDVLKPNLRIASVDAPHEISPTTAVPIRAVVAASGLSGATSHVVIRASGVELARASHTWTADEERWTAEAVVAPVGSPPFTFKVVVEPDARERTPLDNSAVVHVREGERLRVFVLEGRPSWASAFVRRALEADARFEVEGVSRIAPRVSVETGTPTGRANSLDDLVSFDTVVVGGLDALSDANVAALQRFMTDRGGAVVLLPDASPQTSVVRRFVRDASMKETLLDRPARLAITSNAPSLDASELLEASTLPADAGVIARSAASGQPVVWTVARGDGRLFVSGAMDAWRYRMDADGVFDRFWRRTIAGLALEAPRAIDVTLAPSNADGDAVVVSARVRRLEQDRIGSGQSIRAQAGTNPIRLWPDARRGWFVGRVVTDRKEDGEPISITASADGISSEPAWMFAVRRSLEADAIPLASFSTSHGGIDVRPDELTRLESHLRTTVPTVVTRSSRRPMRSAWWLVPFVGCLSTEWWLRRRSGRR
ncbi:MAG TPA: hypothetical protein VH583_06350 [Vicinamibacterales bacterium]|jgi:hypothetical protein